MHARFHRCAVYLLIVLIGATGVGGASLQYVAQDWFAQRRSTGGAQQKGIPKAAHSRTVAFGHRHAPDFHWHTHVHEVDNLSGEDDVGSDATSSSDETNAGYRLVGYRHNEHSCPWLSIVSLLQLGRAAAIAITLPDHSPTQRVAPRNDSADVAFLTARSARGPPNIAS